MCVSRNPTYPSSDPLTLTFFSTFRLKFKIREHKRQKILKNLLNSSKVTSNCRLAEIAMQISFFTKFLNWKRFCWCITKKKDWPTYPIFYTSTKSWRGYIFTSVCLCVCLSVCVSGSACEQIPRRTDEPIWSRSQWRNTHFCDVIPIFFFIIIC